MTEPPQKRGVCLPRSYRGFLDEARICKHNTESIQNHNYEVKVKLLPLVPCIRVTRSESPKYASKE
jgi:hypothetical protein